MNAGRRAARTRAGKARSRLPAPLSDVLDAVRGEDVLLLSAGLAFYALISVVPLLIVATWVTSLVVGDDTMRRLVGQIANASPKGELTGFAKQVTEVGTTAGVAALLTGVWPATSYGSGLARAFERTAFPRRKPGEGARGRGLVLVVILPITIAGGLAGSALGAGLLPDAPAPLGWSIALALGFATAWGTTVAIYLAFPPKRPSAGAAARAAIWVGVGVSLLSLALLVFAQSGADFEKHYATSGMGFLVLGGLWLLGSNALLLAGYRLALR